MNWTSQDLLELEKINKDLKVYGKARFDMEDSRYNIKHILLKKEETNEINYSWIKRLKTIFRIH